MVRKWWGFLKKHIQLQSHPIRAFTMHINLNIFAHVCIYINRISYLFKIFIHIPVPHIKFPSATSCISKWLDANRYISAVLCRAKALHYNYKTLISKILICTLVVYVYNYQSCDVIRTVIALSQQKHNSAVSHKW